VRRFAARALPLAIAAVVSAVDADANTGDHTATRVFGLRKTSP
jgi:hypothetical protein